MGLPTFRLSMLDELVGVLLERVGKLLQRLRALAGRGRGPLVERIRGRRHGRVDIGFVRRRHIRDHVTGRGIDDRIRPVTPRALPTHRR